MIKKKSKALEEVMPLTEVPVRNTSTSAKETTTVLIDKKLKEKAKRYNINISALLNQQLEIAVNRLKEAE